MGLRPEELAILRVGIELGVKSIVTGSFHQDIYNAVKSYAESMAAKGRQDGHAGWSQRSRSLQRIMPSHPQVYEVTAESWDKFHEVEAGQQQAMYQQYGRSEDAPEFFEGVLPLGFYSNEGDVLENIAKSLFDSWRQSPGHWRIVNNPCTYFAYAVADGRRCYFGAGIAAL